MAFRSNIMMYLKRDLSSPIHIKLDTLPEVIKAQPDLVIVGDGITGQEDKKAVAAEMQKMIKQG
jgi:hypothetical protein